MDKKALVELKNLDVRYGEHKILSELSMKIYENEILMLVGANGAGKSTLLKSLFGIVPIHSGQFIYKGNKITPKPHMMVEQGAAFVPQSFRVFPEMTVEENLMMGAFTLSDKDLIKVRLGDVHDIFPVLKRKAKSQASTLSGGERQILSLGRSLMLAPDLLLLDEPSVGLAPKIVKDVFSKISEIKDRFSTTIVIVEHNLKSLLNVADRAVILVNGRIATEGKPVELLESDILERVFFGDLA